MSWRDIGTDDPRVKVRAGKRSRPRTKIRPDYSNSPVALVVGIDRGRYTVMLEGTPVQCIRARELGRRAIVIGDQVRVSGDVSGREGTLARIVEILPRQRVLRRSLEEAADQRGEKVIVSGADLLVIVVAAADPPPRIGMVDRCLVAAEEAGIDAVLCITKADLADPSEFLKNFASFPLATVVTSAEAGEEGLNDLKDLLESRFSVMVGHSGVGKSTLINALIPNADRETGAVNVQTGKGRHTSTSAIAFQLPEGGWVVDTPGVRSFGLSHATKEDVLATFPGISGATQFCLPNCTHLEGDPSCALDQWVKNRGPFADASEESLDSDSQVLLEQRTDLVKRARNLLPGVG